MGVNVCGVSDPTVEAIANAVRPYTDAHGAAEATVYRLDNVAVRVRVVDPDFRGKSRAERHRIVWPLLYSLDAETLGDLTMLLLLTPDEQDESIANRDFQHGLYAAGYGAALKAIRGDGAPAS